MEHDLECQKGLENGDVKDQKITSGNPEATIKKECESLPQKVMKPKKKKKIKKSPPSKKIVKPNSVFEFDEIANNTEASSLIADLVKTFTSNSKLPKDELDILNRTLYEKTVFVFLNILNSCVEKIFNKLVHTEFFKRLLNEQKVTKKDAFCQTDCPSLSSSNLVLFNVK